MARAVGRNADDFWKTILAFVLSGPMGMISVERGLRRRGEEDERCHFGEIGHKLLYATYFWQANTSVIFQGLYTLIYS